MAPDLDYVTAFAALDWQIELGATEAIGETPQIRYEEPEKLSRPKAEAAQAPELSKEVRTVVANTGAIEAAEGFEAKIHPHQESQNVWISLRKAGILRCQMSTGNSTAGRPGA